MANEAWQNGFPGDEGVADLREFAKFMGSRTDIPVAITSNHDFPTLRGEANRYWPEVKAGRDGCVRNTGSRKAGDFICVPIGIREEGLEVQARQALRFKAYDPLSGNELKSAAMRRGERLRLPSGPGALLIVGQVL